ncbi:MAG: glycoside hydrolase family 140 protein [Chitinophagaceae bacterium]|nr:glycoside hydrolase family 140 protein [Chitinophagaceae bacterium]
MKIHCTFLFSFLIINCCCFSQFKISANKRYLLKDDKPFFWLGDTAWELFHRLDREQADQYLKRRAEQGFTVIQAVALAEFDGLHAPNAYGDLPLENDDPAKPREAYFKHVDHIIDQANKYGLTIGFLPTWGDKLWKSTWGKGPEIFTPVNAKNYGKWLGNRYRDRQNIIWIIGGDRNPQNAMHENVWRQMAEGIEEGVGGNDKALISFHPQPNELGSAQWFHKDGWLDFNMFQNGHCRDGAIYDKIQTVYNMIPVKPVMDAEPIYEDHPVCFNAKDLGTSAPYDVRKYAYLDLFAGAHGHTYGCHDIWQFYSADKEAVNNPHVYWQQALELPGANQMKFIRNLMESRPLLDRVPDQSILLENNLSASGRIQATRGKDYLFVYTAAGKAFTIALGKISGKLLKGFWFDPKTGNTTAIESFENRGTKKFTPPTSGYGNDWVLVLDDDSKNYKTP